MAGSAQQKPAALEAAQPDSWTHVNHDPPVSHRHALKISRFRQSLEQFETGVFIQDNFTVRVSGKETSWELRVYPNGYDEENAEYLGIFLKHKEGNSNKYMIRSVLQMLGPAGEKQIQVELPGKVLSSKQMHGTKKYIDRESLLDNPQIYHADSITFLLEAEICLPDSRRVSGVEGGAGAGSGAGDGGGPTQGELQLRLARDLGELFKCGEGSDLAISCQGQVFPCHRAILSARSPVFAAMFRHDTQERQRREVEIPDVEPGVMRALLEHCYTAQLPPPPPAPATASERSGSPAVASETCTTAGLLAAADKYQLAELKSACQAALAASLSPANCLDLLILADTHSAAGLQRAALSFTASHLSAVVGTAGWRTRLASSPHIMAQLLQRLAGAPDPAQTGSSNTNRKRRRESSDSEDS